ncbi:hypothetical protein GUITHDRAFT_118319 [Guillardia theta CCMP2712]|uniref:Uncharacterized protein n=1 Tax=Guillardia theta (strain CCMP2712) TaxID=905079 RepID=L1IGZ3_GUITC|nr:hypothetical protein GUITHDRAFT_118319 [Guillardia theta CCMP2712]EKX35508.1 hypothetical protein GUITHDRAFT_118319 [Guillardia theta CCMP2712]|eukprot:XP_005822488.1 hypothetical protein GUITHDRAFT_118319 [Guillardia theta CCMP2712]
MLPLSSFHAAACCVSMIYQLRCPHPRREGLIPHQSAAGKAFSKWWEESREQTLVPKKLQHKGVFPSFLNGLLLRNGPAIWSGKGRSYTHAFDGLAKLTKFEVKEGEVWYSSRFVRSQWYKRMVEEEEDAPKAISVGPTDPPLNQLDKLLALFNSDSFDNAPVNVHQLGGQLGPWVAVTDAPLAMEFDRETLETRGRLDKRYVNSVCQLGGLLLFSTAHPLPCPVTGQTINYFLELNVLQGNRALLVRTDDKLARQLVGSVRLAAGEIPYVHSFGLTRTGKAILMLCPLRMPPAALLNGSFMPSLEWCGEGEGDRTRIYVFDLKESKVEPSWTFEADPLFFYHCINAYEEEEEIVVELCGYNTPDIATSPHAFAYLPNMKDGQERKKQARDGSLYRMKLPLKQQGHVTVKKLEAPCDGMEMTFELPTINPQLVGKKHRHVYGYTGFGRGDESDFTEWAVLKISTDDDGVTSVLKWEEEQTYPSEPTFVPRPDGKEEDDGVVLVQMFDGKREESFLLCLDAKNMKEIGRAYTGQRSSPQFHGQFVQNNQ